MFSRQEENTGDRRMTMIDRKGSPVYREQKKQEELEEICREILKNASGELYLSMRFLDSALSSLRPQPDASVKGMGTDGIILYFHPYATAALYKKSRVFINRIFFHMILHCLFCHLWNGKDRDPGYWSLACDMAVEFMMDDLRKPCLHLHGSPLRRSMASRLKEAAPVRNAEHIYRELLKMELSQQEYLALETEFCRDDHSFWDRPEKRPQPEQNRTPKNDWEEKRRKMQTEMEVLSKEAAEDEQELRKQIAVENRERYDYREFLRKFTVLKETMQVDPDAFDYVFYNYGMELYGNMPLIEPLETKESRKIQDFVIVIDTSMSCSGELVRRFLEETRSVLTESGSFFRRCCVHILQCDDRVRQDVVVENEDQMKQYTEHLELTGMGGTDFRPAFLYVEQLMRSHRLGQLKGLLYFTDGKGTFPSRMPPYDTAFVFMGSDCTDADVPPWAIRLVLEEEDLMPGRESGAGQRRITVREKKD